MDARKYSRIEHAHNSHPPIANPAHRIPPKTSVTRFGTSLSVLMGMNRRRPNGSDVSKTKNAPKIQANTYRLRPNSGEVFDQQRIHDIILDTLTSHLNGVKYNMSSAKELTCRLANSLERRVKELKMPRYKVVCHVTLSENKCQGLAVASRCLWDSSLDNWACATFENDSICATANVYGIYFE